MTFVFKAAIWRYQGPAGWYFVTLPKPLGKKIKELFGGLGKGFGSLKVRAEVLALSWETSIFPDSKSGSYLLPVKAQIRKQAGISEGQVLEVRIDIKLD